MKINYPKMAETLFQNLEPGEIFSYKDEIILMKTKALGVIDGSIINAVNPEDGTFTRVDMLEMVIPMVAELNIKGEMKI